MVGATPFSSSASSRNTPSQVVGLCFDDGELTAVEFRRARPWREAGVVRAGRLALEPGIVVDGEISDASAFASALKHLWRRHRFRSRSVVVGLDGRTTVLRGVELPALEPAELSQAAAYEIGELLSYPLDEAVVSTIEVGRLSGEDDERVRATTLAVHQDGLLTLHRATRRAGLRLHSVELLASSLLAAIGVERADEVAPPEQEQLGVIVHVSSTMTLVAIGDGHGLVFSRLITAGVTEGETSLSDELELELAMLTGTSTGQTPGTGDDGPRVASGISTVVEGVRRTLDYHRNELDPRPVGRLVVCGPQSAASGLVGAMARSMPDVSLVHHRFSGLPADIGDTASFDAAACLAIAATTPISTGFRRFDLRPRVLLERRADRRRMLAGAALAALVAPVLAADGLERRAVIADEARQVEVADLAVEALLGELIGFDGDRELEVEAARSSERVNDLRQLDLGFPSLVRQVAESMPEDTFLISFQLGRANPGEQPTGWTGDPPPATLALTGVADDLDGVGRWLQTVDAVPVVDGLWMTQSAFGPYGATERIAAVFTIDGVVTGPAVPVDLLDEADPDRLGRPPHLGDVVPASIGSVAVPGAGG